MAIQLNLIEFGIVGITIYLIAVLINEYFTIHSFFINFFTGVLITSAIIAIIGSIWCGKDIIIYIMQRRCQSNEE